MNENRLIIASAGSGKTTHLVKEALDREGSVLLLTYTLSNEDVIKKRVIEEVGCILGNITIQTWFSFLLQHWVKPFQGSINKALFDQDIRGMILVNKQSGFRFKGKKGPVYWGEGDFNRHYFNKDSKMYSDKISKFAVQCNKKSNGAVIDRLVRIYDHIFIDEVQDLAGYDLDLLKLLFKSPISVLLVGDPRQVIYLTHHERKYSKYKNGRIEDFIEDQLGRRVSCVVDETKLNVSHRCNHSICRIASRLYLDFPEMVSCSCCRQCEIDHQGVFLVKPNHLYGYVQKFAVTQLCWDKRTKVLPDIPSMNFGESKGVTFDRVLIYPTKDMKKWVRDNTVVLAGAARAKFYVALTRARYSAAIVMNFDEDREYSGINKYVP